MDRIAKLNDLAYKAISKKGLKKKLDERAIKNEEHYAKLDKEIEDGVRAFDFKQIAEANKEVIDKVGDCHLTCLSALECIQEKDCLGICLQIARSEGAIMDPSLVKIIDIVPNFMSVNAFLDSAAYNLEKSAKVDFDPKNTNQNLAMGIGRQTISGILPLYLFKEHWFVAKRLAPSVLGMMCTLDIMGYAGLQMEVIPFAVLKRAKEKAMDEPSELNTYIYELIM